MKDSKEPKQKKNIKLNATKLVDSLAKALAYLVLFISASYGMRSMLKSLDDNAALVLTAIFVLGLTYIIFRNEK